MSEILGNIHSIESCGTVDGPGIRFVVFTQGCPLRCQYCHNPDTWDYVGEAKKMSVNPKRITDQLQGMVRKRTMESLILSHAEDSGRRCCPNLRIFFT